MKQIKSKRTTVIIYKSVLENSSTFFDNKALEKFEKNGQTIITNCYDNCFDNVLGKTYTHDLFLRGQYL